MKCLLLLTIPLVLQAPVFAQGAEWAPIWQGQGANHSEFGSSLAVLADLDGDSIEDFLVGAPDSLDPSGSTNSPGAAFLHSGATGAVLHSFYGSMDWGDFGFEVAALGNLDGDGVEDFAIGDRRVSVQSVVSAGEVNVYSGANFSLLYRLSGPAAIAFFGNSIASVGDLNGDGSPEILVGAPQENFDQGAAYLYSGADGSLLRRIDGTRGEQFGATVCGGGDLDGDGAPDMLIGTNGFNLGYWSHNSTDIVQAYSGRTGALLYEVLGEREFSTSLAFIGDLNRDGCDDWVVGSPDEDSNLGGEGVVRVVSGIDGTILREFHAEASFGHYGFSLSCRLDLDGDGFRDLVIGAPRSEPNFQIREGAVQVLSSRSGVTISAHEPGLVQAELGAAVAMMNDTDGDGRADLLLASPEWRDSSHQRVGWLEQVSFRPFLSCSTPSLSASQGGTIQFTLDFPAPMAGLEYRMLMSTGQPGSFLLGVEIPLALTPMALASYGGSYPMSTHTGMQGTLDPLGDGFATVQLPAGSSAGLVGRAFRFAAVAQPQGLLPIASSHGPVVRIIP